jgi:hypothetical protein
MTIHSKHFDAWYFSSDLYKIRKMKLRGHASAISQKGEIKERTY